jgi:hypothetical protein
MRRAIRLAVAACSIISFRADTFFFDLGPGGLLGANEKPSATSSTAEGRELVDFDGTGHTIQYDNVTKRLELHFGWGSDPDAGGNGSPTQDLNSDFNDGLHIHGPAELTESANIIYNLLTEGVGEDATDPTHVEPFTDLSGNDTGVTAAYDGTVQLVDKGAYTVALQEADLLANRWYINVHSVDFPNGEIRGQLLQAVPEPEQYAALAGLGLLAFAGYRRAKTARA